VGGTEVAITCSCVGGTKVAIICSCVGGTEVAVTCSCVVFAGVLSAVSDLQFLQTNRSLTWSPPFQLNTSQTIVYSITVVKVTEGSQELVKENHTHTYLGLEGKVKGGDHYKASLVAVNAVGRGEETSLKFHVKDDRDTSE